jgi:hypothetical protein
MQSLRRLFITEIKSANSRMAANVRSNGHDQTNARKQASVQFGNSPTRGFEMGFFIASRLYKVIWGQLTKMASIVLGECDPLSKVCLAITHIESKSDLHEIALRLIRTIFERTLGPYEFATLQAKSGHARLLFANGDFPAAEHLQ